MMLNKNIQASEKIFADYPDEKKKESSAFYALYQMLNKHNDTANEIYTKANSGESMYTGQFQDLLLGKEAVAERIKKVNEQIQQSDDFSLAITEELTVLEDLTANLENQYAPIAASPKMEFEPLEEANTKKAKTEKDAHPYQAEYVDEFKRLCDELAATDPWYSKGSKSYQQLRGSLDGFVNRISNCDKSRFDNEFKKVVAEFNVLAGEYRDKHKDLKLDSRQMKRLKIMNRVYALGEKFNNPDIDPSKDYASKLAEKYVHAKAIASLKKDPSDVKAKDVLLTPMTAYGDAKKLASKDEFLKTLPKAESELVNKVKTNGESMLKSFEAEMSAAEKELKKAKAEMKRSAKEYKTESQNTEASPIAKISQEKRRQRMEAHPSGGVGTSDEVLNTKKMAELEAKMLAGDEFNKSAAIPNSMRITSNIKELEGFLDANPKLSKEDRTYIESRIATEEFYNNLEQNNITAEPKAPVTKDDGTVILDHIHLDTLQRTGNGCYSCSDMLLLQSRGLFLDQRQIRNYRMEAINSFADPEEKARTLSDQVGNIVNIGGIATRCLKNTAVSERTYKDVETASRESKKKIADDIRKTVKDALLIHKSPVSLLKDYHYTTIVGYNEKTDTLIFKNSIAGRDHVPGTPIDPDKNHEMPLTDLLKPGRSSKIDFALGYLMTVDPENPTQHMKNMNTVRKIKGY